MRRILIFGLACLFCFSSQDIYARVITYEQFEGSYSGECVDYVKKNRKDLAEQEYYSARRMLEITEKAGFKVDNEPEEGAVIVLPNVEIEIT